MDKADMCLVSTDLFKPHLKLLLFASQSVSGIWMEKKKFWANELNSTLP